jgi:hypothetical protein
MSRRLMHENPGSSSLVRSRSFLARPSHTLKNSCNDAANFTAGRMSSSMLVLASKSETTVFLFAKRYDARTISKILVCGWLAKR